MAWWLPEYPDLHAELSRMDRERTILGEGGCSRCNSLAADLENLRTEYLILETQHRKLVLKAEEDAIKATINVGRMQEQIDTLRREKQDALCRCQGWDTKGMSE